MAALPYIQLYVGDYLADTMHLTTEEHGAYMLLIFNYWRQGYALKDCNKRLANVVRMSNERWTDVRPTLEEFFVVEDGVWRHSRIDADLEAAKIKVDKAKASGKASGRARRNTKGTNAERTLNERSADVERSYERNANSSALDLKEKERKELESAEKSNGKNKPNPSAAQDPSQADASSFEDFQDAPDYDPIFEGGLAILQGLGVKQKPEMIRKRLGKLIHKDYNAVRVQLALDDLQQAALKGAIHDPFGYIYAYLRRHYLKNGEVAL